MKKATRNTMQRDAVLMAVKKLHSHASAEEVHAFLAKDYPHLSRATVYRNLDRLVEEGAIGKVNNVDGVERFDHLTHHHYHVLCAECGKLFDVDMDYLPNLGDSIKEKHGFLIRAHDIVFDGVCPACLSQKGKEGK